MCRSVADTSSGVLFGYRRTVARRSTDYLFADDVIKRGERQPLSKGNTEHGEKTWKMQTNMKIGERVSFEPPPNSVSTPCFQPSFFTADTCWMRNILKQLIGFVIARQVGKKPQ